MHLRQNTNVPLALRNIADSIESGEIDVDDCTVIAGSDVFHIGTVSDSDAAEKAVWNMTYGIHKMMSAVFKEW